MAEASITTSACAPLPEFGAGVARRARPCTPQELFSKLFADRERHVHYFEPAFVFARAALARSAVPRGLAARSRLFLDQLIEWGRAELEPAPCEASADWAVTVAREFAPAGLSDGAWLQGSVLANAVESEVGMFSLRQLMLRFGDPASREGHAARYVALLRSLGISSGEISAGGWHGAPPCRQTSYEHALLGLCLGLFPTSFALETLGFNLWHVALGPCPLLAGLRDVLAGRGACVRYLDLREGGQLLGLARGAIERACAESGAELAQERVARGFAAAHAAYASWVRALREPSPVPLSGLYAPPQEPDSLAQFALERYGELSHADLYYCFANADCHPASHVFARVFVSEVFDRLERAMAEDPRLSSQHPPAYSERTVAELVAAQHEKNVRSRAPVAAGRSSPEQPEASPEAPEDPSIVQVFDGSWLQGFADVQRSGLEEYGWLFRIYASEHGDGDWAYNHCQIFRRAFLQLGPDVMLPKTDRRLYDLFEIGVAALATLAVALNTRHFLPEILGINLGIEATGVGGSYMDQWKGARGPGARWRALAWRLHNSIDNYADGHTKWSLAAVHSFMRRVKDAAPAALESEWRRIWRLWRCQDILTHGSPVERAALAEHLGLASLAPTPV